MKYVYLMKNMVNGIYKIGVSKHPQIRLKQNQTGSSGELVLIEMYKSEYANKIETALHNQYSSFKEHGEWYSLSLSNELGFINECKNIEGNLRFLKDHDNVFV